MSKGKKKITRGSHYLPQDAYLGRFQAPVVGTSKPQIYMYPRSGEPILVGIHNAAKKRDLYNFTNRAGDKDDTFEKMLEGIERQAAPIIKRLNALPAPTEILSIEKESLALFVAFQHVRTPAFRAGQVELGEETQRHLLRQIALRPEWFESTVRGAIRNGFVNPDADIEAARKFALEGKYNLVTEGGEDYFLSNCMQIGPRLATTLLMKKLLLIESSDEGSLITSDHPVIPMPYYVDGSRNQRGGFLYSDVGIPIGTKRFLIFWNDWNDPVPPAEDVDRTEPVLLRRLPKLNMDILNGYQLAHAGEYLFGSYLDQELARQFSLAQRPSRFIVTSRGTNPGNGA